MMELTINGQVYQFNFGMGFLREINKQTNMPVDGLPGVKKDVGFRYALMNLINGDPDALVNILDVANKGQNPRVTRGLLDEYIDDEDTDIDELTETVMGFLESANATKKGYERDCGRCGERETESGRGRSEEERADDVDFEESYREVALNCFRYLGFKSFEEVDRLTIPEYTLLMEAVQLKEVDKDYRNHLQAFLNFAVKAEKKVGKNKTKPVYQRFRKFFDYEKEVDRVRNRKQKK